MPGPAVSSSTDRTVPSAWLCLAAALVAGAAGALGFIADLGAQVPQLWALLLLHLAGYSLGAWRVARGQTHLPLILLTAGLMRLAVVGSEPSLSDDVYRYLWDGRVQLAGINPYAFAPEDTALAHLRDAGWERVNHRHVPTVYPPLAQWLFAAVVGAGGGVVALKLILLICEGLMMAAVAGLLRRQGRDPGWLLLYAWHPLPLLEIAGSAHIDAVGVAALMICLLGLDRGRRWVAATGLAAATLVKLVPAVCALALWRHWGRRQGTWTWLDPRPRGPLLLAAALVAAAYVPYLAGGVPIFDGLQTYALKWRFNDGLFAILYELLRDRHLEWDEAALLAVRKICLALWLGIAFLALRQRDPLRICFTLLGACIVLAPTVHPWYLLWILPFLPLTPHPAWLAWSWLVLLSYEVLIGYRAGDGWAPAAWARWAQYGPFYLLLAGDLWLRLRRRRRHGPQAMAEEQGAGSDV